MINGRLEQNNGGEETESGLGAKLLCEFAQMDPAIFLFFFRGSLRFITKRSEGQQRSGEEKEKSIKDRERTQEQTAGEEEETDWEKAGKERREDA